MKPACITRIATATPPHDVHAAFIEYATGMVKQPRVKNVLRHMAQRSGIDHRYSFIQAEIDAGPEALDGHKLFRAGEFPSTSQRMQLFERFAPLLLRCALERLALSTEERRDIRHVIVTCCTGFYAPGLDFAALEYLDLDPGTDRTLIGFMGCYAAINGLKLARHIIRSEPDANVLMINIELCSLHFQETQEIEKTLSFLLFGDGCSASLIQASDRGFALEAFQAFTIPAARDLIRWRISDERLDMELSGKVPAELGHFLQSRMGELNPNDVTDLWAVHPGGRSILDADRIRPQFGPR